MSNVLNEEKKKQVIALGQLGWALRRIEEATGVRRETAARYLKAAGIPVRQPGGWGRRKTPALSKPANEVTTDPEGAKPANGSEVTTDSGDPKPPPSPSTSEPYRELIESALSLGRNAMSVWQELVDRHGFTGSYESVKRYARKLRGTQSPEACGIIETAPGEESQVDYGTGPMVRDGQTGKYRRTRLFVLTLGFSRKCVRLLRFHSSTRIWAELHEQAFRRLGGVTRFVIPDNLKEGVLKQAAFRDNHRALDSFDFTFNPKMNRSLVFDLATCAFIGRREDALFLGPGGTGKSHLAQAIGQAAILQGYRVFYREAHVLLDELADAVADGKRKQYLESLAAVPLLIVDDFGMRKLPLTAAEDLLEIVMRRYERASTLLTSNRPVEDRGKLLGDTASVSSMLDRLLHHGHVLKCGPRSWRTKASASVA